MLSGMRTSPAPTVTAATDDPSTADPTTAYVSATARSPRRRSRHAARPARSTARRRGRASGWPGRLAAGCGVLAGLGLIASAVLLGVPAGAEEHGPSTAVAPSHGYRWPLDGTPEVTRRFDPPAERWLAGHRGVDLASSPEAVVRAAGPGVVHFSGYLAGRGVVSVMHPNGLLTTYEPLTPLVKKGQSVRAGDPIGRLSSGHLGCPVAACLHWGLRHGKDYLDPLSLLGYGRVRLLPLEPARR